MKNNRNHTAREEMIYSASETVLDTVFSLFGKTKVVAAVTSDRVATAAKNMVKNPYANEYGLTTVQLVEIKKDIKSMAKLTKDFGFYGKTE